MAFIYATEAVLKVTKSFFFGFLSEKWYHLSNSQNIVLFMIQPLRLVMLEFNNDVSILFNNVVAKANL
jgi:hypothetical protein